MQPGAGEIEESLKPLHDVLSRPDLYHAMKAVNTAFAYVTTELETPNAATTPRHIMLRAGECDAAEGVVSDIWAKLMVPQYPESLQLRHVFFWLESRDKDEEEVKRPAQMELVNYRLFTPFSYLWREDRTPRVIDGEPLRALVLYGMFLDPQVGF